MKKITLVIALMLALFLIPRLGLAHAIVLACLPRIGSTVTAPPAQLVCQFNEPLVPNSFSFTVTDAQGQRVDQNDAQFYQGDNYTLVLSLDAANMKQGIYTGRYNVTSAVDNGVTSGEFQFGVNMVVPPTPTAVLPGAAMTPTPVQPSDTTADLIPRFLVGGGIVLLVAVGVLYWRMRAGEEKQ